MKCTTVIDLNREEEVLIFAHQRNALTDEIESLVNKSTAELVGFAHGATAILCGADIYCFTIENNKVYAITAQEQWQVRERLYTLEELFGRDFIRIHQSCLVQVKQIARFEASIGGALMVVLKNGYRDYISRRQLKVVKERMGF